MGTIKISEVVPGMYLRYQYRYEYGGGTTVESPILFIKQDEKNKEHWRIVLSHGVSVIVYMHDNMDDLPTEKEEGKDIIVPKWDGFYPINPDRVSIVSGKNIFHFIYENA